MFQGTLFFLCSAVCLFAPAVFLSPTDESGGACTCGSGDGEEVGSGAQGRDIEGDEAFRQGIEVPAAHRAPYKVVDKHRLCHPVGGHG